MYICLQIIFLIIFLTACYNPNNNNVIIPVNFLCGRKPEETGEPRGNGRKLGNPEETGGKWGTRRRREETGEPGENGRKLGNPEETGKPGKDSRLSEEC